MVSDILIFFWSLGEVWFVLLALNFMIYYISVQAEAHISLLGLKTE